ncbi:WecB/TagA/CpsF family glycosyltransferase [Fontimonas sp. SYSU GA230001]|uniref:WecB/TagA/CpsF family glycosyltransferase n=1 Tax=Fontimonas sp. SYSU GA230001 TaxID=3142450 RepID=UPI0032B543D8
MTTARTPILGFGVQVADLEGAVSSILRRVQDGGRGYAVLFNTHMCSEAHRDPALCAAVESAEWVFADGRPIYWLQRLRGASGARQVRGADLTWALLDAARRSGTPVGFFGGSPHVLELLQTKLASDLPGLDLRLALSPPHGGWSEEADRDYVGRITAAGVRILFVALGCPRQELWMMRHVGELGAVMLGIGAAVDFCAGVKPQAPRLLQRLGLEWLYRLATEPRRLWRRYLFHNMHFLALLAFRGRRNSSPR